GSNGGGRRGGRQNPGPPPYRQQSPLTSQGDQAAKQLRPPWGKAGGAMASARQKIASALAWRARQNLVLRVMLHVSAPSRQEGCEPGTRMAKRETAAILSTVIATLLGAS